MTFIPIENLGGGSAKLPDGVLYDSGKGINNWDNSGYTLASGWNNKGGFTINANFISGTVPTSVGDGSNITIIYDTKLDLSKYSKVVMETNEGTFYANISALSETTYLIITMWSSGSERALRVCFSNQKNYFASDKQHEFDVKKTSSYFSITINKIYLEV